MRLVRRAAPDSAIPTSSMADIAFLLIVFFMVTSVFSATRGLELELPADEPLPPDPTPEPAVVIRVGAGGIDVDCTPMTVAGILPYLEPRLTRNPAKPVVLVTASDAEYRRMVEVYDMLGQAGAEGSPWSFAVENLQVPTRRELDEYRATFGADPFAAACGE